MPLANIQTEADADITWTLDVAPLNTSTGMPTSLDRHKHKICMNFTAAGDWVELLYQAASGAVLCLYGTRFTASAAQAAQTGVVCFEFHSLAPGFSLRRSGGGLRDGARGLRGADAGGVP